MISISFPNAKPAQKFWTWVIVILIAVSYILPISVHNTTDTNAFSDTYYQEWDEHNEKWDTHSRYTDRATFQLMTWEFNNFPIVSAVERFIIGKVADNFTYYTDFYIGKTSWAVSFYYWPEFVPAQ